MTEYMEKKIGRLLFQYRETDYEFLKRIASHLGLQLNCDIINTNNVFYFGRQDGRCHEIEDDIDYASAVDLKTYREALVYNSDLNHTDYFYYTIKIRKVMEIGDKVIFKKKKLYVNSYEAEYVRGELIYTYKLCREKGLWQKKLYNEKIIGTSLEGEIIEVRGEEVKLHLKIDETQDIEKAKWFRFAPPTGNLLYSMPIVGTNGELYFGSETTEDPMVIGCVRKNGATYEKFNDVNNRYFATESGNYLDMLPGAININRQGLNVNLNDKNGINIGSKSNLNLSAGYIGMFADKVDIKGDEKFIAKKNDASFLSLENSYYAVSNNVYENGSDRSTFGDCNEAKDPVQNEMDVAFGDLVAGVQGSIGKCLNANLKKDIKSLAKNSPNKGNYTKEKDMDELPLYTEIHTSPEFNSIGADGIKAKYECTDGTMVKGTVTLGSDMFLTFTPDNKEEYRSHNSWFSKSNFKSMRNGLLASGVERGDNYMDLFLIGQTPFIGWDKVKSQMEYEHAESQKQIEQLRNEAPSKRMFDNTNTSVNSAMTIYDIVTVVQSLPQMYKSAKSLYKLGKLKAGSIVNDSRILKQAIGNVSKNSKSVTLGSNGGNIEKYASEVIDEFNEIKGGKKVAGNVDNIAEDSFKAGDDVGKGTKGAGKAESVLGKIDFSKLDKNEVKDLINRIDKSILSDEDKIIANIEIYNNAIEAGVKVDIQVIASPNFIDSSGGIKWPDESGYTIDTITGKAIKNEVIPKKGDIIDRYGSPNGTFTSPINDNVSIPYEQRALPYLENKNVYHQYKITRNFDELSEAIKSCKDKDLVEMINADALRYGINLDNLKTYGGEIAPAFDAIGGGTQWQLPLSVDYLIKLGFLKEIK